MQRKTNSRMLAMLSLCLWMAFLYPIGLRAVTVEELLPTKERINIVVKKSFLIKLTEKAERVSVVAPEVADVQIVDPRQILITGSSVGETSLIIWSEKGEARMIDVCVKWNTEPIRESIKSMLPDEAIEIIPLENGVALKGQITTLDSADQALEITQAYSPNVVNLMQMPGHQQVLLKVKIAEVASSFRKEAGFNFLINNDSFQGGSTLGNLVSGDLTGGGTVDMSDVVTLFFGFPNSDIAGFIQALKTRGWIHVLAQPNLIARSGETASFLAGGEFPIPVPQGVSNVITIEYKEYGVRLNFTPTVISEKTIHLDIAPEVSDLDFSNGLRISGYVVPNIVTRRAKTVVQLQDGQTFAIAGLLNKKSQKGSRKIPGIGEVPILGSLFSGKEVQENETELLIMVTPHLIAPLENGEKYAMPSAYEASETAKIPPAEVQAKPIEEKSKRSSSAAAKHEMKLDRKSEALLDKKSNENPVVMEEMKRRDFNSNNEPSLQTRRYAHR